MQKPLEILKEYWGYDSFRSMQEEIINSVLEGKDTLALLPTGGGKSICFQVPALAIDGICVVITPLIALMIDQVQNLKKRGITAEAIHSGLNFIEIENILFNCNNNKVKFLYLSPERLVSKRFLSVFKDLNITLIAVDEAHCISEWGYDFRKPYLKISDIRQYFPQAPIIALTATAVPEIATDIQEKLLFKNINVFSKSFVRQNLVYVVRNVEDKHKKILRICDSIKGTGIIYVRNRRKTVEISNFLNQNNITADFYHAGLNSDDRQKKQQEWTSNITRIMVSTNAFGMGIDKPDVRFVIHYDIPENIEAYYQEAGRAGRDEKKSFAIILYQLEDILNSQKKMENSWPTPEKIREIYQLICNFYKVAVDVEVFDSFDFDIAEFSNKYNQKPVTVFSAIKILEREGYIQLSEGWDDSSKLMFLIDKDHLYNYQQLNNEKNEVIKTILRMYAGAFRTFVKISETQLAKTLNIDQPIIEKILSQLDSDGIITYIKRKIKPQIIFSSTRVDANDIFLSDTYYYNRKKNAQEKLKAMFYYLQTNTCRSKYLVSYFGEKNSKECGVCDYCLAKKKQLVDNKKKKEITAKIEDLKTSFPLSVTEIVSKIKKYSENDILNVIRDMVDSGILVLNQDIVNINKKKRKK